MRKDDKATGSSVALQCRIESLRLQGEGAGVVVSGAVDEQQRLLDEVRVLEGAHGGVGVGRLPQCALLRLEPERRQRPVVCAAASDTSRKKVPRMRQQVCCHECPVAVATNRNASWVHHASIHHHLDGGFSRGNELLSEGVVGLFVALCHNWHGRPVQNGVPAGKEQQGTHCANVAELMRRGTQLSRCILGFELLWVSKQKAGKAPVPLLVVAWWQVQGSREVHTIVPLVPEDLLCQVLQGGEGVRKKRQATLRGFLARPLLDVELGGLLRRLPEQQQL
mmetsp:Transcript_11256/g.33799  ORF Transcript_11256/g.33799 Transcript_11256/m.33799 type:complete len:279 (+) Transcript_11256:553-1389(+)